MSAQTNLNNSDESFDEDDVFNHLFRSNRSSSRPNPAKSLKRIFADTQSPPEIIDARDFLPKY